MRDDPLDLRLGRLHGARSPDTYKYLTSVLVAAAQEQMPRRSYRQFQGTRIGRGNIAALMLGRSGVSFRTRGAYVKVRIARMDCQRALRAAKAHLHYIQRDSAARDGRSGCVYSASHDCGDGQSLLKRPANDRHQFRLIAAANDSAEYDRLSPLVRRFMARMEEDLETKLEWVAADHFDTLHPHTHIILRGIDDHGGDLVIAPEYIRFGMGERFAGIVSIDLGPLDEFGNDRSLRVDVDSERLTSIDNRLLEKMDCDRIVLPVGRDMKDHSILTGRLQKLGSLGLAEKAGNGRWKLNEDVELILRTLGEKADIFDAMKNALASVGIERSLADHVIHQPYQGLPITGKVIASDLQHALGNENFVVLDGIDGRVHCVAIAASDSAEYPKGAILRVSGHACPGSANLERLSLIPIERLPTYDGPTWLDRQLISPSERLRDKGFGRQVRSALALRRAWLLEEGLASRAGDGLVCRSDLLSMLERREITGVAKELGFTSDLPFLSSTEGQCTGGLVLKKLELASGHFALIEASREFALTPWRPVLEKAIGEKIKGVARIDGTIDWTIERARGLER